MNVVSFAAKKKVAGRLTGSPAKRRIGWDVSTGPISKACAFSTTTLSRYSALTFNGHRIHYDADYCRDKEGYENLVIHGPLVASLIAAYAEDVSKRRIRDFSYRAVSPALLSGPVTLHADMHNERVALYATTDTGSVCMQAEVTMAGDENSSP